MPLKDGPHTAYIYRKRGGGATLVWLEDEDDENFVIRRIRFDDLPVEQELFPKKHWTLDEEEVVPVTHDQTVFFDLSNLDNSPI